MPDLAHFEIVRRSERVNERLQGQPRRWVARRSIVAQPLPPLIWPTGSSRAGDRALDAPRYRGALAFQDSTRSRPPRQLGVWRSFLQVLRPRSLKLVKVPRRRHSSRSATYRSVTVKAGGRFTSARIVIQGGRRRVGGRYGAPKGSHADCRVVCDRAEQARAGCRAWTTERVLRHLAPADGAPWADIPSRYGPHTTCVNRFNRWRKAGVWGRLLEAVSKAYDGDVQMIDSSRIRVHQHAANGKKNKPDPVAWPLAGRVDDEDPRPRRCLRPMP